MNRHTIEIEIDDTANPSRPSWHDWIPADELDHVCAAIRAAGCGVRVLGVVDWRRQLARMENNPEN